MKWNISTVVVVAFFVATAPFASNAQTYDELTYKRMKSIVPNVIANAERILKPEDRTYLDDLNIRIDRRTLTNASATFNPNTGRPEITIYTGIVLVIDLISQIAVVQTQYPRCASEYFHYMYRHYRENTERVQSGLATQQLKTPPGFFSERKYCREAQNFVMKFPDDLAGLYNYYVEGSITFLFLHELAHLELEHERPSSASQSRFQENEADEWALKRLPEFFDVWSAFPIMIHTLMTGGISLEEERRMSHPLGSKRLLKVIDKILETRDDPEVLRQLQSFRRQLRALID